MWTGVLSTCARPIFCEYLGPAQASESYLNIPKILEAARRSGAEAIHPGYGFLSENAKFARACRDAGIVFIGPSPESMEMMGSKTRARQNMKKANVPFVPGTDTGLSSAAEALAVAEAIGYPVMLKAAAGGGGKGMSMVRTRRRTAPLPWKPLRARPCAPSATPRSTSRSSSKTRATSKCRSSATPRATSSTSPSASAACSAAIRRFSRKRPAPSSIPTCAAAWAKSPSRSARPPSIAMPVPSSFSSMPQKNFYFLEMNTRLQVEHPVTELVTGIDLVQLQFRVAAGEPLPFKQQDIVLRGHAMELRIYAEDPDNNFFPSPGRITRLMSPSGPGIRRDSGVYEGWVVPLDYDPLLAKLIAYGENRPQVINRLRRALGEYFIGGIKTNLSLFRRILLRSRLPGRTRRYRLPRSALAGAARD